ncbi:hypothetical protein [Heyndrickxia acidiproducens]|nr:hypothetical protein [Heyndrickxia acidiproducens]
MRKKKGVYSEETALEFGDINAGKIYEVLANPKSGCNKKQKPGKK